MITKRQLELRVIDLEAAQKASDEQRAADTIAANKSRDALRDAVVAALENASGWVGVSAIEQIKKVGT
jgi:hypothetical protein